MTAFDIHKEYILEFPREKVFDMWVSPTAVVSPVTAIDVNPQIGGVYKLTVEGESSSQMIGKFVDFSRPEKLVYTWEWNHDGEVSQVDVTFSAIEEGTRVIIKHTGFNKKASRDTHDTGWDSYIKGLQQILLAD